MNAEESTPLVRLLDDPDASSELRADLSAAQSFQVPFDAGAGLARFQAHLDGAGGTAHVPSSAAASPALQLTGGKILAALALAAGLGFGVLELTGGNERKSAPPERVPAGNAAVVPPKGGAAQNASPARDLLPPPVPSILVPPAPAVAPPVAAPKLEAKRLATPGSMAPVAPATGADVGSNSAAPKVTDAPAPSAADRLAKEVAHLGEVRRALASDPARALSLTEQGHVEFADGALRQEREALALSALEKLGRRDALNQRGAAFLKRYPQSSFAPQVKRMIGQ